MVKKLEAIKKTKTALQDTVGKLRTPYIKPAIQKQRDITRMKMRAKKRV